MRIITSQFNFDERRGIYDRLLNVFLRSAAVHIPRTPITVLKTDPPELNARKHVGLTANTVKLRLYLGELGCTGRDIAFMDCDTMFLGDVSDVFDSDFDIAYTERTEPRIPLNGGVLFVRDNERAYEFMKEYCRVNNQMYGEPSFHSRYKSKYHGMNQAAFGYMLENYRGDARVRAVPAGIYNSCEDTWINAMERARVVHIKGRMRRWCKGDRLIPPEYVPIVNLWRKYDGEPAEVVRAQIEQRPNPAIPENMPPISKRRRYIKERWNR